MPELLGYLAHCVATVQEGQPGFDLASYRTDDGSWLPFAATGMRFFYGGFVCDPQQPGSTERLVPSRAIAERAVDHLQAQEYPATTLERLGDAATIDRLNLWDTKLTKPLQPYLDSMAASRPELAERIRGAHGRADLKKFAALVWKEGLSAQYAREAGGPVAVINTAPYERQTWFENERPAALGNGHTTRDDITYAGFTHAPLTAAEAAAGQKSQPLNAFTGPLTDRQADDYMTFPTAPAQPEQLEGLQTHANLEELYQHAVHTRDKTYASTPAAIARPPTPAPHPRYPPRPHRPTR
ncbi:hypothetical protein GCM10009765_30840 [Fodinicola feengrottensis]|uniref:Uncharacterized protein n=1 Tax=Fodinicola feengrottensis TaxID=435914 RepID=A0ABP4SYV8_9ACTN